MQKLRVSLAERSYDVLVGIDLLPRLGELISPVLPPRRAAVVTDSNVRPIYWDKARASLSSSGFEPQVIEVPAGEESKSLQMAERLYGGFIEFNTDRTSAIIALGGGMVGDLAGFAAATFMRGVPYVQVPTSLLAQIDSSVGGKVAVNLKSGKNLVGAFYQPRIVIADITVLKTLPRDELLGGMAEAVKYGVIMDAELFDFVESHSAALLALNPEPLEKIVTWCCRLKAQVVERDETESGMRSILNFGHTLGHALESIQAYRGLKHGHAVAVGMVFAARLAFKLGKCSESTLARLKSLLEKIGLSTGIPRGLSPHQVIAFMQRDKKARAGELRWVLPARIGSVEIGCKADDSLVVDLLKGKP